MEAPDLFGNLVFQLIERCSAVEQQRFGRYQANPFGCSHLTNRFLNFGVGPSSARRNVGLRETEQRTLRQRFQDFDPVAAFDGLQKLLARGFANSWTASERIKYFAAAYGD